MNHNRQHHLTTAEGIEFSFLLASPLTRGMAWFIDYLAILTAFSMLSIAQQLMTLVSSDYAVAFMIISYFLLNIFYPILSEYFWQGQTLGKWVLKIRVVDKEGLHLEFSQIFLRNILRLVDGLPSLYAVGGIMSLLNSKSQRLGDIVANTIVIHNKRFNDFSIERLALSKDYNLFAKHPYVVGLLRKKLSIAEIGVLYQAIYRREELEAQSRVQLFREIMTHLREKVSLPADLVFGISDEELAKHCLAGLLEKR